MSDVEIADRLTRRRARMATVLGIVFVATQGFRIAEDQMTRPVDYFQFVAWGLWLLVLLLFLLFGGAFFRSQAVRDLMNDEPSEQNRRRALVCGFWAMIACIFICYALSFYEPVSVREALHVIVTVGVGAALMRFGALERRSLAE
ncbi:MAG: hypothetical protein ABW039_05720 [Sphingobium sp.]